MTMTYTKANIKKHLLKNRGKRFCVVCVYRDDKDQYCQPYLLELDSSNDPNKDPYNYINDQKVYSNGVNHCVSPLPCRIFGFFDWTSHWEPKDSNDALNRRYDFDLADMFGG